MSHYVQKLNNTLLIKIAMYIANNCQHVQIFLVLAQPAITKRCKMLKILLASKNADL